MVIVGTCNIQTFERQDMNMKQMTLKPKFVTVVNEICLSVYRELDEYNFKRKRMSEYNALRSTIILKFNLH